MASWVRKSRECLFDRGAKCWLQLGWDRQEGRVVLARIPPELHIFNPLAQGMTALSLPKRIFKVANLLPLKHPPTAGRGFSPELPGSAIGSGQSTYWY